MNMSCQFIGRLSVGRSFARSFANENDQTTELQRPATERSNMPLAHPRDFRFLTIVVIVFAFGAAAVTPSSVLGSRLREIGWQRPKAQAKPAIRERMQQALDPLSRALPLSPTDVSQTRLWLIQAGYRSPQHVTIYRGLRVLFAASPSSRSLPSPDSIRPCCSSV
jgi:hypothetical protein